MRHFVSRLILTCVCLAPSVATAQTYEFIESPHITTVIDETGVPYEIPFFGGFNNPVPQLIDFDDDGDLDLFIQEVNGSVQFYSNEGSAEDYQFRLEERRFSDLDVGTWFQFADVDDDQDFDLLTGQTFNAVRFYRNEVSGLRLAADSLFSADGSPLTTEPPNVPVIADMDCDGNLDLLLGRVSGSITLYTQTGLDDFIPVFDFVEDNYQEILVVGEAGKDGQHGANALAAADLNGDTFLDLIWGDFFEPSLIEFRNTTSDCSAPDLERVSDTLQTSNEGPFTTRGYNLPAAGDLNGDGMVDIVAGVASNATVDDERNLYLFENESPGIFQQKTTRLIHGIDVGSASVPAFGDIDGDGTKDLIIGNSIGDSGTSGELTYYRRDGNEYVFVDANLLDDELGFSYNPYFGDLDDDGDDDLVVGLFDGSVVYHRNNGPGNSPQFQIVTNDVLNEDIGSNAAPALMDLDNDGDLDMVVGESSGILNYFRNTGTPQEPQFTRVDGLLDGFDFGQNSIPTGTVYRGVDGVIDIVVGSESEGLFVVVNSGDRETPIFTEMTAIDVDVPAKSAPRFEVLDTFDSVPDLFVGNVSGGLLFFAHSGFGSTDDNESPTRAVALRVYPNPSQGRITIGYDLHRSLELRLVIRDILGRHLKDYHLGLRTTGSHTERLSLDGFAAGVYLAELASGDQRIGTGTIVIAGTP